MRIGFIGFGEAAYNISLGLQSQGVKEIVAYDTMEKDAELGELIRTRSQEAKVKLLDCAKTLAKQCDIIFCSVPSVASEKVFQEIKENIPQESLYIDVSASTPSVKERIWEEAKKRKIKYVDAAMMGSLPKDKHQVPIMASGLAAEEFKHTMTSYGMKIQLMGKVPGQASAIKLIRSIYMKGLSALMVEMLEAAQSYGVSDEVVHSISASMDGISFESHLNRLVTGSAIHSVRRANELKGSLEMLKEKEISGYMTEATIEKLNQLSQYQFHEKFGLNLPTSWQDILKYMQ